MTARLGSLARMRVELAALSLFLFGLFSVFAGLAEAAPAAQRAEAGDIWLAVGAGFGGGLICAAVLCALWRRRRGPREIRQRSVALPPESIAALRRIQDQAGRPVLLQDPARDPFGFVAPLKNTAAAIRQAIDGTLTTNDRYARACLTVLEEANGKSFDEIAEDLRAADRSRIASRLGYLACRGEPDPNIYGRDIPRVTLRGRK